MASAQEAFRQTLQTEHPEFADYLMREHPVPPGWQPTPEGTAELLAHTTRDACRTCAAADASKRCTGCNVARYCSVDCQRSDWPRHKTLCAVDRTLKAALKETLYNGHTQ